MDANARALTDRVFGDHRFDEDAAYYGWSDKLGFKAYVRFLKLVGTASG